MSYVDFASIEASALEQAARLCEAHANHHAEAGRECLERDPFTEVDGDEANLNNTAARVLNTAAAAIRALKDTPNV